MNNTNNKLLPAPQIDTYIYHLRNNKTAFDEKSRALIATLFDELRKIAPSGENGLRQLFFKAERGTIEDYGNFEDMLANGEVDSGEQFEQFWREEYPQEYKWYHFAALEDNGYVAIWLGHELIIQIDPQDEPTKWGMDIEEFVKWFVHLTKNCIADLQNGMYNETTERDLPAYCRTGTIIRKEYWDIFPEYRADYFTNLSMTDARLFIEMMSENAGEKLPKLLLPQMTTGIFYHCCYLGYKANNYAGCDEMPTKELYLRHADGRDEGLRELAEDSPEEFNKWYFDRSHAGGHPWEICKGGNSTHISLYIMPQNGGFYFCVAGKSYCRSVEAIKFYLALVRENIPVIIGDGLELAARIAETDKIGIVPSGVMPCYCEQRFSGEKILDFMHLPDEKEHLVIEYAVWQKLPEQKLLQQRT